MRAPSLVIAVAAAACATATTAEHQTTDAHEATDAPHNTDGAVHVDAAPGIDAPAGSCTTPTTGVLATWAFAGQPGSQVSTPAASSATGIVAGPVARSGGVSAVSGAGSINSNGWELGSARNLAKYYTLTIAPPSGCQLDLTKLAIDANASSSGPAMGSVATSADAFAATTAASTAAPSTPALAVVGASGMIEVRIYGFAALAASGTFRIQNTLTISGSLH